MATSDEAIEPILLDDPPGWLPGPEVLNHDGGPIGDDGDFFAPPPPEIGPVQTAYTSLRQGRRPPSTLARGVAMFLPGTAAIVGLQAAGVDEPLLLGAVFLGLFLPAWWFLRFRHRCTYVGAAGVARFDCKGRRDRIAGGRVFLFESATVLKTEQVRMYHNGVYTGTQYKFRWFDDAGRLVFKLSGGYYSQRKPPKPKDPFHFAASAERLWSTYVLQRGLVELQADRPFRFPLGAGEWLALRPGILEIHRKGQDETWSAEEIGGIEAGDGVLKIRRVDAREGWFSSEGVLRVTLARLGNAQAFLVAFARLVTPD